LWWCTSAAAQAIGHFQQGQLLAVEQRDELLKAKLLKNYS
jgi:hypothetical protein